MGRGVKYLFRLAILALIGLIAYALIADLPPPTRQVEVDLAVPAGRPQPEPAPATVPAAPASAPAQEAAGAVQE